MKNSKGLKSLFCLFWKDTTLQSLSLLLLRGVFKLFQFVFLFLVAHYLSQEEFGDFTFVAGVVNLIVQPTLILSLVVARLSCSYPLENRLANMRWLLVHGKKRICIAFILIATAFYLLDPALSIIGNLGTRGAFAVAGVTIAGTILFNYYLGFVQALEAFKAIGILFASLGLSMLLLGGAAVGLDMGMLGVLSGEALSRIALLIAAVWIILRLLPVQSVRPPKRSFHVYRYGAILFITMLAFFVSFSMDTIVVKTLFNRTEAGYYLRLDFIGKMIFLLGSTFAVIIFPRVCKACEVNADPKPLLYRYGLLFAVGLAASFLFLALFSDNIFRILYEPDFDTDTMLLWTIAFARAIQSFFFILINYLSAMMPRYALWGTVTLAVAQGLGVMRFHNTPLQVITVNGIAVCFFTIVLVFFAMKYKRSPVETERLRSI